MMKLKNPKLEGIREIINPTFYIHCKIFTKFNYGSLLLHHFVESTVHCNVTLGSCLYFIFNSSLCQADICLTVIWPNDSIHWDFSLKKKIQKNSSKSSLKTFKIINYV